MDKFEKFIGADKIIDEVPDLKSITDNLRQYPVMAVFAAIIYKSNPETTFEILMRSTWTFAIMLLTFMILAQTSLLWIALIGSVTSLDKRGVLAKLVIFPTIVILGIMIFYALVIFLIKIISSM